MRMHEDECRWMKMDEDEGIMYESENGSGGCRCRCGWMRM
jgi:hypothetical protein